MKKIYKSYKCKGCHSEFILMNSDISKNMFKNKYLSCPYCGCKKINPTIETDDLRECMKHMAWKKEHGVIKQVRQ
ncbi:hypothetical protein [Clostridium sp. BJN0001]|uniref:hypothetical protein n=1 Tax=Clostridium sp. BJN0001 TaxID=2930219 RepID=UPI001FD1AA79|nr:hypothetical protein [Clostridium sp. BJN0001]